MRSLRGTLAKVPACQRPFRCRRHVVTQTAHLAWPEGQGSDPSSYGRGWKGRGLTPAFWVTSSGDAVTQTAHLTRPTGRGSDPQQLRTGLEAAGADPSLLGHVVTGGR